VNDGSDGSDAGDVGPGLAVVGTGTGVGKTVVTAGLTGWLRAAGIDARSIKPAQTGHPPDDDAGYVVRACGEESAATCLRRLEPALAPAVAARETGVELDYPDLFAGCRTALADADVGVVEGIGGLRVPLADGREVLDLVADLGLPALVVARSGLGTLNHTGLTVDALERRDVPVRGVVLNDYRGADLAERTNPRVLKEMIDPPVHTLGPLDAADPPAVVAPIRKALPEEVWPAAVRERLP
jgi:dethiobiotin synthetase